MDFSYYVEKLVSCQYIGREIRWTVIIKCDSAGLDLMKSKTMESLELYKHLTYEVHIKESVRVLGFCLILLPRILLTVLKIFLELLLQALSFYSYIVHLCIVMINYMFSWPSDYLIYSGKTSVYYAQVSLTIVLNLKNWKKTKGMMDED